MTTPSSPTLALTTAASLLSLSANAASIIGYDILNAQQSGFGNGWAHNYSGSITPTGVTGTIPGGFDYTNANYSNGTGTLADGVIGTAIGETQLFATTESPVISLNLAATETILSISLLSFVGGSNNIPGNIDGVDVTIDGTTHTIATTVLGARDEFIDLTGTPLEGASSDTIVLSNFTTSAAAAIPEAFSISEIIIDSTIPEPSSALLLGLGAMAIAIRRRS